MGAAKVAACRCSGLPALDLAPAQLEVRGAHDVEHALYRIDYTLSAPELG